MSVVREGPCGNDVCCHLGGALLDGCGREKWGKGYASRGDSMFVPIMGATGREAGAWKFRKTEQKAKGGWRKMNFREAVK